MSKDNGNAVLKAKDYATDQDVRWCPGCGDYSILKQVQSVMAELAAEKENTVFISGIGCSSRFPYYMDTYGIHGIHGRAMAIASGVKASNPKLDVWVITGDGDGLSIGGNHMIHLLRRNFDLQILLFNNEIYGLTKGQYSPTSPIGSVSKSTPYGSVDHPFNPLALAIGADGTFIARTMDRDPKHQKEVLKRSKEHKGASFVEIYQNCNVFNDGAFFRWTEKDSKPENSLFLEHEKPLLFNNDTQGIILDGFTPVVVSMDEYSGNDLWIHDETNKIKASILSQFFAYTKENEDLPRPFGVFYVEQRETHEDQVNNQIDTVKINNNGDLDKLLSGQYWEIK